MNETIFFTLYIFNIILFNLFYLKYSPWNLNFTYYKSRRGLKRDQPFHQSFFTLNHMNCFICLCYSYKLLHTVVMIRSSHLSDNNSLPIENFKPICHQAEQIIVLLIDIKKKKEKSDEWSKEYNRWNSPRGQLILINFWYAERYFSRKTNHLTPNWVVQFNQIEAIIEVN